MLLMLCALISCGTVYAPKKADTLNTAAVPSPGQSAPAVANTNITSGDAVVRDHLQSAVNALQAGQEANAKSELAIVLRQDPENKMARSLLAQIQTDPAKYFSGPESFNYTLQPGDTLTSIAQRFLDEPLKFYILARFNGINDSSRLAPGRVIKVPGRKPGGNPVAAATEDPPKGSAARGGEESRTQLARRFYDAGKYQQAIEALSGSGAGNNEARDLLSLSYGKYAEELAQNENLIDAQSVLENAVALQPGNDKLRKQLKQVQKQREIERLYKSGTESMVAGDNDKALEIFNAVLKLDPKHEPTKQHIASINAFVVETMHKDAMVEYGKQNLDQAIALWDRVLAMSPSHANAKLYRARAIDLKSRLQKMEQKPVNVE
ncbi:MAG: tetratricopeptide repeat protein [Gammaproteobacteria bacterium]|nr:tetratricopeptide repeat protein [Gammaproteobacteria bacterium]